MKDLIEIIKKEEEIDTRTINKEEELTLIEETLIDIMMKIGIIGITEGLIEIDRIRLKIKDRDLAKDPDKNATSLII